MARTKSIVTISLLFISFYICCLLILIERHLFSHDHVVQCSSHAAMLGEMTVSDSHSSSHTNDLGAQFQGSGSLSSLMARVLEVKRPIPDISHDHIADAELCQKFGNLKYENRTKRRRIFAGSLIADDSWHVIGAQALETYGIFHSITFVESNRTQSFEPRTARFESNPPSQDYKMLQSGIYGPNTTIHVDNFVHETKEKHNLLREHMMRQRILVKWKELGMTKEDVGIIFDVDEIPSRDALRATQICELPNNHWRTDDTQTCLAPLLSFAMIMYEGSPKCIYKNKTNTNLTTLQDQFYYFKSAAMVIGACIEGIGDGDKYPSARRQVINGDHVGHRLDGYGLMYDYSKIPNGNEHGFFPRYTAADFRKMARNQSLVSAGYHLHNFFDSAESIRFKYRYYGHVHKHAYSAPLGAMNADMSMLVKCVHDITDEGNRKQRLTNALEMAREAHAVPEAFRIESYIDARHQELSDLVTVDEEDYGRADAFDGNHLFHDVMITHTGKKKNTVLVTK